MVKDSLATQMQFITGFTLSCSLDHFTRVKQKKRKVFCFVLWFFISCMHRMQTSYLVADWTYRLSFPFCFCGFVFEKGRHDSYIMVYCIQFLLNNKEEKIKCHVMHIWYNAFYFASFIFIVVSWGFFKKVMNYFLINLRMNMIVKNIY